MLVILLGLSSSSCDLLEVDCPGTVRISVKLESPVEFDWKPDCEASGLWVADTRSGEVMWVIEGEFKPPVVFGRKPRATNTIRNAIPLESGSAYRVELIGGALYGVGNMGKQEFEAP